MLIELQCGTAKFLLEVSGYASLKEQADEAFSPFLRPGKELDLYYQYDYDSANLAIDASVKCQATFRTFLKIQPPTSEGVPLLFVRQCDPLVVPLDPGDTAAAPAPEHPAAMETEPSGSRKSVRPGGRKSAPPPQSAPESADVPPADSQPISAKTLLSSFNFSATEQPQIRAVLQDGSFSTMIKFDPYNPPSFESLQNAIRDDFISKLHVDISSAPVSFLLSAVCIADDNHMCFDVDDLKDILRVTQLVQKFGEIMVQIYVEIVTEPKAGMQQVWTDNTFVPSPTKKPLEVNQCHTPYKVFKRERERAKALGLAAPTLSVNEDVEEAEEDQDVDEAEA